MSRKRRKRKSGNHQEDIEILYNTEEDTGMEGEEKEHSGELLFVEVENDEPADFAEEETGEEKYAEGTEDPADEEGSESTDETDDLEDAAGADDDLEADDTAAADDDCEADDENSEPDGIEGSDRKSRRRRRRRRRKKKERKPLGKKFWIILGSIFGGLILVYLGISAYFIGL